MARSAGLIGSITSLATDWADSWGKKSLLEKGFLPTPLEGVVGLTPVGKELDNRLNDFIDDSTERFSDSLKDWEIFKWFEGMKQEYPNVFNTPEEKEAFERRLWRAEYYPDDWTYNEERDVLRKLTRTEKRTATAISPAAQKRKRAGYFLRSELPLEPVKIIKEAIVTDSLAEDQPAEFGNISREYVDARVKAYEEEGLGQMSDVSHFLRVAFNDMFEGYNEMKKPLDRALNDFWWYLRADQRTIVKTWDRLTGSRDYYEYGSLPSGEAFRITKSYHKGKGWATGWFIDDVMKGKVFKDSAFHYAKVGEEYVGQSISGLDGVGVDFIKGGVNMISGRFGPGISLIPGPVAADIIPDGKIIPWVTSMEKIQVAQNIRRSPTSAVTAVQQLLGPWLTWTGLFN